MPKELDPQQLVARVEGNVKSFDEDHDRYGMPIKVGPVAARVVRIKGENGAGETRHYIAQDGVFLLIDNEGNVHKRGEYDGGEPFDVMAIGRPYGEIASVSSVRMRETHGLPGLDKTQEALRNADEKLARFRAESGVIAGQNSIEIIRRPTEQERFEPAKAVNLRFLNANLHLVSVANFKSIETSNRPIPHPPELTAYFDREARQRRLADRHMPETNRTIRRTETRRHSEDTRRQMVTRVIDFLGQDPRGKSICDAMGISPADVTSLEPHQVIELIGQTLYEVTNYDHAATSGNDNPADNMDALSILENGFGHKRKKEVRPLGVCRNYSAVGQELFYAFKEHNPKLVNTHCFNSFGLGAAMSGGISENDGGHAWLDFVMVAGHRELVATTVDPTWTRKSMDGKIYDYDQIDRRMGTHIRTITAAERANVSGYKDYNSMVIVNHYKSKINKSLKQLSRRYKGGDGKVRIRDIPDKDPRLQSAVFNAVELEVFSETIGGGYRFKDEPTLQKLVARAADIPAKRYTSNELFVILKQVCQDAEAATTQDDRAMSLRRIDNLESISARMFAQSKLTTDMNDGRNLESVFMTYGFSDRLIALVGPQKSRSLVRDLLGSK